MNLFKHSSFAAIILLSATSACIPKRPSVRVSDRKPAAAPSSGPVAMPPDGGATEAPAPDGLETPVRNDDSEIDEETEGEPSPVNSFRWDGKTFKDSVFWRIEPVQ